MWIAQTLAEYEPYMQPVADTAFKRLKAFYPPDVLQRINRVLVDRCPVPPLAVTGIDQLAEIESWDIKGVPWLNTIFIRSDLADWEPVHFHELLHIIQWDCLGTKGYLTVWAVGTTTQGYRDNPLEEMAFRHQARFESEKQAYDVVGQVKAETAALPPDAFDISRLA
jgi:hypothetical protein